MESELSGIFRLKLLTKSIERGSPGTEFMHMRVNRDNLTQPTQMQLSQKQKTFPQLFSAFLNSRLSF